MSVLTIEDPVFTLGGATAPTTSDSKDRGIEFHYYDTDASAGKKGFFGWGNSDNAIKFLLNCADPSGSEIFTGDLAEVHTGPLTLRAEAADHQIVQINRAASDTGALFLGIGSGPTASSGLISANNDNLIFGKSVGGTFTEAMRIDTSGNVGIGTTAPAAPLAVKVGTSGTEDKVFELLSNDDRALSILQPDNAQNNDFWTFATNNAYQFRVDAIDALTITHDGNVGIGTSSPDSLLHCGGNSTSDGGSITLSNSNSGTSSYNEIIFKTIGDQDSVLRSAASLRCIYVDHAGTNPSGELAFSTKDDNGNLLERQRIDSDGNVGIGTTSPNQGVLIANAYDAVDQGDDTCQLKVHHNVSTTGAASGIAFGVSGIETIIGAKIAHLRTSSNSVGGLLFYTRSDPATTDDLTVERMRIDSSGNVGINEVSPSHLLHLSAGEICVDRTTEDAAFFNYKASADGDATSAISTLTTSGATTHHIQVDINGTKAWIAVSTNNPS